MGLQVKSMDRDSDRVQRTVTDILTDDLAKKNESTFNRFVGAMADVHPPPSMYIVSLYFVGLSTQCWLNLNYLQKRDTEYI